MPDDFQKNLASLAATELALYNELAALVDKEMELVRSGNLEELLEVLTEKQDIISRQELVQEGWNTLCIKLGSTEGRDGPVFWDKVAAHLGPVGADDLKASLAVIRDTAGKVLEEELKVQALLEECVEDLRQQMIQLDRGKQAVKGYIKAGGSL